MNARTQSIVTTTVALCLYGCNPGTTTIVNPDAAGDATTSSSDDSGTIQPGPDGSTSVNDVGASDMGGADATTDASTEPDLPPQPARFWTAETDGTIAWWTFDPATRSVTLDGSIERGGTQNFLTVSADGERLYAINQNRVEAFDITSLPPTFLGDADAGVSGNGTHLAVDATRSHVFVAWYGGDGISMLPLDANGAPSDATVVLGGANDPSFCERAHQVRVHPSNDFVYVPCLVSDHVVALDYDAATGTLTSAGAFAAPPGSGPRHMDFHPTLNQAYVIGEQDDTITRFEVDAATGALTQLDVVSTRPNPGDPLGPASDIHVSPDGRHLVGINRNPRDEVVTFDLAADGTPSQPHWVATGGEHARTFAFTPDGGTLLVGNSNSMDMSVFDFADGEPTRVEVIDGFDARLFFVGFE